MEPKKSARLAQKRKLREETGTPGPYEDEDYFFTPLIKHNKVGAGPSLGATGQREPKNNKRNPTPSQTQKSPSPALTNPPSTQHQDLSQKSNPSQLHVHVPDPILLSLTLPQAQLSLSSSLQQPLRLPPFQSRNTNTNSTLNHINLNPSPLSQFLQRRRWAKSYESHSQDNVNLMEIEEELQRFKIRFSEPRTPRPLPQPQAQPSSFNKKKGNKEENSIAFRSGGDSLVAEGYKVPYFHQPQPQIGSSPKPKPEISCFLCPNPKKYICSKTKKPLCSLGCYEKNMELG